MNSFAPAPEKPRWGKAWFNGEIVFEGDIDRKKIAHFNAVYPAVGLRIYSEVISEEELIYRMRKKFQEELELLGLSNDTQPSNIVPPKPKPNLRIVKNENE